MMAEVFIIGLQSNKPLLIALVIWYFVNFESSMCCIENTGIFNIKQWEMIIRYKQTNKDLAFNVEI